MTLALYRKYRPRTFAEIIGQEHVTAPLSQALRTGRLNHAYLFSGPRGCGKTSSARILARSLNCEKGPTPDPCGECDSCRALAPDGAGSIDVIEIDAASHGGVDDARDLRERAFFAPVSSRYKIYVIDEAHMVSSAGFNALLKLVEEPPDYVKFVFATTEPEKVLATIKSRTHHYPFRLIPPGVLRPYLEQLATAEGVKVEPAVFPLVVRAGGGSARDSLSVLDQLIAGAGAAGVTYAQAVALLGVTDVALIDEVCDALAAGDGAAVYTTIHRVAEAGHDARRFAGDLLERLRNLIVLQQVPDAIDKGLLDGSDDELARMRVQAERFGPATLSRMADIVHTGLIDMRGTTAPRLVLELIAARMLLPGAEDSTSALLARMERMERRITLADTDNPQTDVVRPAAPPAADAAPVRSAPAPAERASRSGVDDVSGVVVPPPPPRRQAAPAPSVAEVPTSEPSLTTAPVPAPGAVDAAGVRRIWDEVLTLVRRKSPRAAAVVREATVREVHGDVLVLLFKHAFHAEALAASPGLVQEALYEVLGGRWQITCEVVGQSSGSTERLDVGRSGPASVPSTGQPGSAPGAGQPRLTSVPGSSGKGAASDSDQRSAEAARGRLASAPTSGAAQRGTAAGQAEPAGGLQATVPTSGVGQAGPPTGYAEPAGGRLASVSAPDGVQPGTSAGSRGAAGAGPAPKSMAVAGQDPVADEEDWPTTATLGGSGADGGVPTEPVSTGPGTAKPGSVTKTAPSPAAAAVERASTRASTAPSSGRGASRGAASRPAAGRAAPGNRRGAAPTEGGRKSDEAWAGTGDEPPWDPEFDGPVSTPSPHVGFDPGDEPLDDETDPATRPTTEQQALDLLRDALGAEKIGES